MTPLHSDPISDELPSGLVRPQPTTNHQGCLFRISLADALFRLRVSPDDLRRWYERGWLSFGEGLTEEFDEFDDPRVFEIQVVRDIVRSGLTDVQIENLLAELPKPFAFDPTRLAFSFRYGWVCVEPPVEIPEPSDVSDVIEQNIDDWIAECDEETLEGLQARVADALRDLRGKRASQSP